jgi:hypothetical protein
MAEDTEATQRGKRVSGGSHAATTCNCECVLRCARLATTRGRGGAWGSPRGVACTRGRGGAPGQQAARGAARTRAAAAAKRGSASGRVRGAARQWARARGEASRPAGPIVCRTHPCAVLSSDDVARSASAALAAAMPVKQGNTPHSQRRAPDTGHAAWRDDVAPGARRDSSRGLARAAPRRRLAAARRGLPACRGRARRTAGPSSRSAPRRADARACVSQPRSRAPFRAAERQQQRRGRAASRAKPAGVPQAVVHDTRPSHPRRDAPAALPPAPRRGWRQQHHAPAHGEGGGGGRRPPLLMLFIHSVFPFIRCTTTHLRT